MVSGYKKRSYEIYSDIEYSSDDEDPLICFKTNGVVEIRDSIDLDLALRELDANPARKNEIQAILLADEFTHSSNSPIYLDAFRVVELLRQMDGSSSLKMVSFHSVSGYTFMKLDEEQERKHNGDVDVADKKSCFFKSISSFLSFREPKVKQKKVFKDPRLDPRGFDFIVREGLLRLHFPNLEAIILMGQTFSVPILLQLFDRFGHKLTKLFCSLVKQMDQTLLLEIAKKVPNLEDLSVISLRLSGAGESLFDQKKILFDALSSLKYLKSLKLVHLIGDKRPWLNSGDADSFTRVISSLPLLENLDIYPASFLNEKVFEIMSSRNKIVDLDLAFISTASNNETLMMDPETLVSQIISLKSLQNLKLLVEYNEDPDVPWMTKKINESLPNLESIQIIQMNDSRYKKV